MDGWGKTNGMKDTMFFTSFTAISETTGKIYHGFRLCRTDEDENNMVIPNKADMVDHIYRKQMPYGNGVGAITIINMVYHRILKTDNILLNLN